MFLCIPDTTVLDGDKSIDPLIHKDSDLLWNEKEGAANKITIANQDTPPKKKRKFKPCTPNKYKVTSGGYQTDMNMEDMNHYKTFLAKKKRKSKWPKRPVSRFMLSNEKKAKVFTGM